MMLPYSGIGLVNLFGFFILTASFNIDIDIPVFKLGGSESYFGYAVAQHFRGDEALILVGAPKGESGQVGTHHAGALFACPLNNVFRNDSTTRSADAAYTWCLQTKPEYPVNPVNGDPDPYASAPDSQNVNLPFTTSDAKDNQWLGATVSSVGTADGRAVVCAPTALFDSRAFVDGVCYLLSNNLNHERSLRGCMSENLYPKGNGHNEFGVCELGFSGVMSKDYDVFVTGGPGALNWRGSAVVQALSSGFQRSSTNRYTLGPDVPKGPASLNSVSYFGYAVGAGLFGFAHEKIKKVAGKLSDESVVTIVGGTTRYNDTSNSGAVLFMPFDFDPRHDARSDDAGFTNMYFDKDQTVLLGDSQLGASFGYSLAVVNLDADECDDLIVGAPNFYNASDLDRGGAVYVYYSMCGKEGHFRDPIRLYGTKDSGFGTSVVALGDINMDGKADFAVGAPFADKGGMVYIFHGALFNEFDRTPSQIITAEDMRKAKTFPGGSGPLKTFGWSLSGGVDMDKNGYPDLVVGAFQSNAVLLLRSRPVVHVFANYSYSKGFDKIDKDKDSHQCDGSVCFTFETVLTKGNNTKQPAGLSFRSDIFVCVLEILPRSGYRAEFDRARDTAPPGTNYSPHKKEWPCGRELDNRASTVTHHFKIPESNRDWLTPLEFKFYVKMQANSSPNFIKPADLEPGKAIPDINQFPVLDAKESGVVIPMQFNKHCGDDNECKSDLRMVCTLPLERNPSGDYIKTASNDPHIDMTFNVKNLGDNAFESHIYVTYNEEELEKPSFAPSSGSVRVGLDPQKSGVADIILGNPFAKDAEVNFTLRFSLVRGPSTGLSEPLNLSAHANTSSIEMPSADNECSVRVKVVKLVNIALSAQSMPDRVMYGGSIKGATAMEYEEEIGPVVRHQYIVENTGSWGVTDASVIIQWPYQVESKHEQGKYALYVLEKPQIKIPQPGKPQPSIFECTVPYRETDYINPMPNIKVNRMYTVRQENLPSRPGYVADARSKRGARPDGDTRAPRAVDQRITFSDRPTRELRVQPKHEFDEDTKEMQFRATIDCRQGSAKCFNFTCKIPYLDAKLSATIEIRSRLWNGTFVSDFPDVDYVNIWSNGQVELDSSQGLEQTNKSDDRASTKTQAAPDLPKITQKAQVPIWIIIVAVIGGIFILFIIIIAFWWCGFFQRRKRPDAPYYTAHKTNTEMDEYGET